MPHGLALTWPEIKNEFALYQGDAKIEQQLIQFYEDLFQIWARYHDQVNTGFSPDQGKINDSLRQGRYLLADQKPSFDPTLYRAVLAEVIAAAVLHFREAASLQKALDLDGLQAENLPGFLADTALLDAEQLCGYLKEKGWPEKAAVETSQLAFVLSAAIKPFYVVLAESVSSNNDYTLWREGYCPVCGQKPFMAFLRKEDGARFLECRLCNTQWQFKRLDCPFCRNSDFEQLHHFYADEYPGRRVQLCERCKSYLKTVIIKELGRSVTLELENIFTLALDYAARREGYHPGEDLAVLA